MDVAKKRTMALGSTDDLDRTMQRVAMLERRLERLEALMQNQPISTPASQQDEDPNPNPALRQTGNLKFPELRLQLAEAPTSSPVKDPALRVSKARAALESCPHLLEPLSTLWRHPELERYVSRLLVDDRGGRQGFSAEVVEELLFLAQVNHQFCPTWRPRDPWEDSQFLGDRR